MKNTIKSTFLAVSLVAGGLASSIAAAATQPASVTEFSDTVTDAVFSVRPKSWYDPAFGDMGWTHHSQWGSIQLKKGEKVQVTLVSETPGLHPAMTVWRRGKFDTAPDTYVTDHFYAQNSPQFELDATDESTGAVVGNIVMNIVNWGFDKDGNNVVTTGLRPRREGIPGILRMTFTAPADANYMFVVGAINPKASIDTTQRYNIDVNLTKLTP